MSRNVSLDSANAMEGDPEKEGAEEEDGEDEGDDDGDDDDEGDEEMKATEGEQAMDAAEDDEDAAVIKEFGLDSYDDDDNAQSSTMGNALVSLKGLTEHTSNKDDPYITLPDVGCAARLLPAFTVRPLGWSFFFCLSRFTIRACVYVRVRVLLILLSLFLRAMR